MFDPPWKLALGLLTGVVFGILLQKGGVTKFRVIVGQFLLRDWTVLKIMGTAVIVGSAGIYGLLPIGAVTLHLKALDWAGIVAGGACFGVGMAIFGYCPGTSVAACGEGRRDAMVGLLGMLGGALVFVLLYPTMTRFQTIFGSQGRVTLPDWTGTEPWHWIAAFTVVGLLAMWMKRGTENSRVARREERHTG